MTRLSDLSDDERALRGALLGDEPPAALRKRSDDAFARAVAEGVRARRPGSLLVVGLAAAAAGCVALAVVLWPPSPAAGAAPAELYADSMAALDDDALDDEFAFPADPSALDEEALVALHQALDEALEL